MTGYVKGEGIFECFCCGQWPNYMDKYVRTGTISF